MIFQQFYDRTYWSLLTDNMVISSCTHVFLFGPIRREWKDYADYTFYKNTFTRIAELKNMKTEDFFRLILNLIFLPSKFLVILISRKWYTCIFVSKSFIKCQYIVYYNLLKPYFLDWYRYLQKRFNGKPTISDYFWCNSYF